MSALATEQPAIDDLQQTRLPVENGDHLTATEFERRWERLPNLKKAELLDGVVHMPAAVSQDFHGRPHGCVVAWLGYYFAHTPGVDFGDNATLRLDLENEPQPDAFLAIRHSHGGQSLLDDAGYIRGAPELTFEVGGSSVSIDSHAKLQLYRRQGVKEYVIWRVYDGEIDWHILRNGEFVRADPLNGVHRSTVFPGLWLDVAAMIKEGLAAVLKTAAAGVADPAHAEFVKRLADEQARVAKS